MVHLLCIEVGGEVLTANLFQILDVVLVSGHKEQVAPVCQVLQTAAVDEPDHVRHGAEVQILPCNNVLSIFPIWARQLFQYGLTQISNMVSPKQHTTGEPILEIWVSPYFQNGLTCGVWFCVVLVKPYWKSG